MIELTQQRLREALSYDPDSGLFAWRWRSDMSVQWNGHFAGKSTNYTNPRGYCQIRIDDRLYLAHRLAWFYVHGQWPVGLDHINGQGNDNRIRNLRVAPQARNLQNTRLRSNNTSGLKGVSRHKGKWRATIRRNRQQIHLGLFETPQSAHAAYCAAATKFFGEFANYG